MIESQIARRYARALAETCDARGTLAEAQKELALLADVLDPSAGAINVPELLTMLYGPRVPKADKMRLADILAEQLGFSQAVCALMKTLIRRNRITLMSKIQSAFHELASARRNVTPARVESAVRLAPEDLESIRAALAKVTGDEVELTTRVVPKLLGGVRVSVRNRLIDGSIAGALNRLEQHFANI